MKTTNWPPSVPAMPGVLYLADAALSASEKTIQALELAKEEQQRIRKQLKGNIEKYQRLERRKAKKA